MEDVTRNCNRLVPSGQKGSLGLYLCLRVGRHAVAAKFINSHQLVLSAGRLFYPRETWVPCSSHVGIAKRTPVLNSAFAAAMEAKETLA